MGAHRVSPKIDSNVMTELRERLLARVILPQLMLGTTLLGQFGILVL